MRLRRLRHRLLFRGAFRPGAYIFMAAGVSLVIGFALGLLNSGPGTAKPDSPDVIEAQVSPSRAGTAPPVDAQPAAPPPWRRGLWVVRHALRTPESIDGVIATALDVGADALFVQVNGRMEAYYRSRLLPPAPDAAPDFDPLDYVIFRARDAGLQVHAWINVFTAGMLAERPSHPDHVLNRRPDWVTVDRTGRSLWDYTWQEAQVYVPARMLDPGVPGVQQFVLDAALEVVDSYDVDGIHLDYVRYPSRRFGYHPESISRFMAEHGFDPMEVEQDAAAFVAVHGWEEFARRLDTWDEWRRSQVSLLVARLREAIDARGGGHLFSVAVGADAHDAVTEKLQHWPAWLEDGLVDAVLLMAYSPDTDRVAAQVEYAAELGQRFGAPVYAGIGAYLLNGDAALLRRQVNAALSAGAEGIAVFSYDTLAEQPHFRATLRGAWDDAELGQ